MKPRQVGSSHSWPARAAAWILVALLPLCGCLGGSTTEGGNPEITLQFQEGSRTVRPQGTLQFIVAGANPEFVAEPAGPGDNSDGFQLTAKGGTPATVLLTGHESPFTLERGALIRLLNPRPYLGLSKISAASARAWDSVDIPDFNVILDGSGDKGGFLTTVRLNPDVLNGVEYSRDTLVLGITPGHEYSGTVDNSTPAGKALALFVPGTTYLAQVKEEDRFTFTGIPEGKLPLRWVSTTGIVYAMTDSLGAEWTRPLRPGERQDSIYVPPILPPPTAAPPGRHTFSDSVAVVLAASRGAAIHYTLDGSGPTRGSPIYSKPVLLRSSATLKAIAFMNGRISSPVSINDYGLVPYAPAASPPGTSFRDSQTVVLTVKSRNAAIRYTLDGSNPSRGSGLVYLAPIVLTRSATLKAVATVPGLDDSRILEETYLLLSDSIGAVP